MYGGFFFHDCLLVMFGCAGLRFWIWTTVGSVWVGTWVEVEVETGVEEVGVETWVETWVGAVLGWLPVGVLLKYLLVK